MGRRGLLSPEEVQHALQNFPRGADRGGSRFIIRGIMRLFPLVLSPPYLSRGFLRHLGILQMSAASLFTLLAFLPRPPTERQCTQGVVSPLSDGGMQGYDSHRPPSDAAVHVSDPDPHVGRSKRDAWAGEVPMIGNV